MLYDFKICKNCTSSAAKSKYQLNGKSSRGATVWVCSACGAHYIDYLDHIEAERLTSGPPKIDQSYSPQSYNFKSRHVKHIELIDQICKLKEMKVLDVGCGGGKFLSLLKNKGADVHGIDLDTKALGFARSMGLDVSEYPIENKYWQSKFIGRFDVITLWDVIEHVNFPPVTIMAAKNLLRGGGYLFISTPCRDAFYYRTGALTYNLSGGRFPSFLNMMYSNQALGHKQILSSGELHRLLERADLNIIKFIKIHELSLPYENYLKKFCIPDSAADVILPFVKLFFKMLKIRNKMIIVGRKN